MSERDGATGDGSPGEDLAAILHDDEFVESIVRGGEVPTSSEDEADLAVLFSGARHEIISAPMPGMPSDEELAAALQAGVADAGNVVPLHRSRRRRWMTTAAAGAASVAVLLGGIAVAGHFFGAESPAGQSSEQYVTAASVRDDLARAQDLLANGDTAGCLALLDATAEKMEKLRGNAAFAELDSTRVELWAKATGLPKTQAPAVGEEPAPPAPPTDTSAPAPPAAPQGGGGGGGGGITLPQVPGLPSIELPQVPMELIPQIPLPPPLNPAPPQQPTATGNPSPSPTASPTPSPTGSTPAPHTATDEPSKEMLKQKPSPSPSPQKKLSDLGTKKHD